MVRLLLAALVAGCTQDYRIDNPPREGGFVNQLDGTPEDSGLDGLRQVDPTSPDVSTAGTRFLLAYLQGPNSALNGPASNELWIESDVSTNAEIVGPQSGFALQVAIVPGVNVVPLPAPQLEPVSSGFVFPIGLELLVEDPVHAVAVTHRRGFTEATRLLPYPELGVTYRVITVPDTDTDKPNGFVVVAAEDETTVTVTPAAATTDFHAPWSAFDVTLQQGEVVQFLSDEGDLTGSLVKADKKVAVFSGGQEPLVDCEGQGHAWEQMPPVSRFATDWLVAPWPEQPYQYAIVLARDAKTVVTLDCLGVAALGAGQAVRVRIEQAGHIRANRPVLVTQLAVGGTCERDPDEIAYGDPDLALATRAALYRGDLWVRPAEHPTLLATLGADDRNDRLVVFRPPGHSVDVVPIPAAVDTQTLDGWIVEASRMVRSSIARGDQLRGTAYATTIDNAYSYDLGVDCEGCGADLEVPALCD